MLHFSGSFAFCDSWCTPFLHSDFCYSVLHSPFRIMYISCLTLCQTSPFLNFLHLAQYCLVCKYTVPGMTRKYLVINKLSLCACRSHENERTLFSVKVSAISAGHSTGGMCHTTSNKPTLSCMLFRLRVERKAILQCAGRHWSEGIIPEHLP